MLSVVKLHPDAALPTYAYTESAAMDLCAHLLSSGAHSFVLTIPPNAVKLVGTGLAMRPPPGHVILVCSRSGLAARGIFVANAPGVVDPDYTGEIKVALYNGSQEPHFIRHRDRIAQILIVPFAAPELVVVDAFAPTVRGDKGFGSTGD